MADKKITELTPLTSLTPDDLFVVVDDPTGTPITKKIAAADIFANGISFVTSSTYKGATVLRSILTANVSANTATANTLIAGEFVTNATASSSNSEYQYAVRATSALSGATANVTKQHATAKFILDVSNSATLMANTYVGVFQVANTGVRVANVQSFVGFGDAAANSTSAQTLYLFDVGLNGSANVSANTSAGANSLVLLSNTADKTVTHTMKVRVNGQDMWLLMSNTAPA